MNPNTWIYIGFPNTVELLIRTPSREVKCDLNVLGEEFIVKPELGAREISSVYKEKQIDKIFVKVSQRIVVILTYFQLVQSLDQEMKLYVEDWSMYTLYHNISLRNWVLDGFLQLTLTPHVHVTAYFTL